MRKLYILILMLGTIGFAGVVRGETVSQKEASRVAATFFNSMYGEVTAVPKLVWNGKELTTDRLFSPFYVYNCPRGGFVAISADNKAYPVLAYGRTGKFDKSSLGEAERKQFERYAREIELIRYDSRLPVEAMESWQHLPDYITRTLQDPYNSEGYRRLTYSAREEIEEMDRRNGWIVMPGAVEFNIYDPERYRGYTLDDVLEEEYVPFSFYEDFLSDMADEERTKAAGYESILHPSEARLRYEGGGNITVFLPVSARLMRVYALDGRRMQEKYFKDTPMVHIDLAGLSSGYYVVLILGDDNSIHAFKVSR